MVDPTAKLDQVLRQAGAQYAVVRAPTGERAKVFGHPDALPDRGIVQLVDGPSAAQALFAFLDGAILPQVISQGSAT